MAQLSWTDTKLFIIDTYEVGGSTITLAETTVKGTTAQHGTVEEWEKPAHGLLGGRPAVGVGLRGRHPVHFPRSANPMSFPGDVIVGKKLVDQSALTADYVSEYGDEYKYLPHHCCGGRQHQVRGRSRQ